MDNKALEQFAGQKFLNLETFRKVGTGVKTPVWFVQDGENFLVWTPGSSGKAKRARNNGSVNVAPCKSDGTLVGTWCAAKAAVADNPESLEHTRKLMTRKYGFAFRVFAFIGDMRKVPTISLQIELA